MLNLIGKRFGRLIITKRVKNNKWGTARWLCKCDCKNEIIVTSSNLRSGYIKSCGCLATKHGHSNDEIYQVWQNMKDRCTNPKNKRWKNYGGRGITVCEEWLHSFPNFLRDNPGWESGLTLERKDKNGNYCSGNCKWATWKEQARNRRSNCLITAFGKTQCITAWSEETGIPRQTIEYRINHDWPPEKALTRPVRKHKKYKKRKNDT